MSFASDTNAATSAAAANSVSSVLGSLGVPIYGASQTTTATPTTGTAVAGSASNTIDQSQFLQLITAQIQNQDPLNPTDNTEFVTQLAEIGSLQSTQQMANSFSSFATSMQSSMALMASSLVGQQVLVTGNTASLSATQPLQGTVNLSSNTNNLLLNVYDSTGSLVQQFSMGSQSQGQVPFSWNGTLADGTTASPGVYTISAVAEVNNAATSMPTSVWANVNSVSIASASASSTGTSGITLNVANIGSTTMDQVQQIA